MSNKPVSGDLFNEFDPSSRDQWIEKVKADLNETDFHKKLVWCTMEEFEVQPFYMKEDLKNLDYLHKYHNSVINKDHQDTGPRYWINNERIKVHSEKEANTQAQEALHMGADGLEFDFNNFSGKPVLQTLLNHINPGITSISFSGLLVPSEFLIEFFSFEKEQNNLNPEDLSGSMNFDPIKGLSLSGQMDPGCWDELDVILKLCLPLNGFKAITVNGGQFLNAGGSAIQEIAFNLNTVVDYIENLTDRGFTSENIIKNIQISMGVGTDYFMEIAKLRALRILFNQIAISSGFEGHHPGDLNIHSQSSIWTKTIFDPYVNMLRNTTEAMSAILGGCNSLSIEPFDSTFANPSNFSRRISRNISNLLKDESYFDKVADPAAGSYYIETLTDKLVNRSWELFKEIETVGGFIKAFDKGIISESIKEVRIKRLKLTSKRRNVFVGTNQYPNPLEYLDPDKLIISAKKEYNKQILPQHGGAIEFEELRLTTEKHVSKNGEKSRPHAYLVLIGDNKIMRKARATFSTGFMGCAGFKVTEGSPSETIDEAIDKTVECNADIVVICGSDDDYVSWGVDFAKAYKAKNNGLLILAGYPLEIIEDLHSSGVDDFIHLRVNAVEVLSSFQKKLDIK